MLILCCVLPRIPGNCWPSMWQTFNRFVLLPAGAGHSGMRQHHQGLPARAGASPFRLRRDAASHGASGKSSTEAKHPPFQLKRPKVPSLQLFVLVKHGNSSNIYLRNSKLEWQKKIPYSIFYFFVFVQAALFEYLLISCSFHPGFRGPKFPTLAIPLLFSLPMPWLFKS